MRIALLTILLVGLAPSLAFAANIVLANGDILAGEVLERTDDAVVLEHPVLGRVELKGAQLATEEQATEALEKLFPPPPAEEPPPPGLWGTRFLEGWKRKFGAGITGSQGAAETFTLNGRLTGDYEDDGKRWEWDSGYAATLNSGSTDKSQGYADLERNWLLPDSKWFYFGKIRYDFDIKRAWNHRLSSNTGVGYDLWQGENGFFRPRAGLGLTKTWRGEEDLTPEGLIGFRAGWKPFADHEIKPSATFFKTLDDGAAYRITSQIDYSMPLIKDYGVGLTLGARNEYDSSLETDRWSLTYYSNIDYTF